MASVTDSISSIFTSIFDIFRAIIETLLHVIQTVFATAQNLISSTVDLAGGLANFLLSKLSSPLPEEKMLESRGEVLTGSR